MELGVGIHGEPGRRRAKLGRADPIAEAMIAPILADLDAKPGTPALLLVNGFGGTPAMELYLMANAARRLLESAGLHAVRMLVGSYVTSLDMAGCSFTVTALDEEMLEWWDKPVHTAALRWGI